MHTPDTATFTCPTRPTATAPCETPLRRRPARRQRRGPVRATVLAALLFGAGSGAMATPVMLSAGSVYNSLGASLNHDGSRVAFYSADNLTGANADHNFEVHVYDRPSGTLRQITNTPGGISVGGSQAPRISADGQRMAFQTFERVGNTSRWKTQIYDDRTGSITDVTPFGAFSESSAISADGSRVAVQTDNTGVRLYDVAAGTLSSPLTGNVRFLSSNADGSLLAFASFDNRIRLIDTTTGAVTDVSSGPAGINSRPTLSADGRWLTFVGNWDPLGTNADGNAELFLYDVLGTSLRQITQTTGSSMQAPSISADGSRIAFSSNADLLGTNGDRNYEIFHWDLATDLFTQVTDIGADLFTSSGTPSISGDGRWVGFFSNANFGGLNPRGSQQVWLQALAPLPSQELPVPGTLALALTFAVAALGLPRRRRAAATPR